MHDVVTLLRMFDSIGHRLVDAFFLPSLEAILLGVIVWAVLRAWRGHSPRLRHLLWLTVILKPVVTLFLPWQGPIAFPVPGGVAEEIVFSVPPVPTADVGAVTYHPYAILAIIWGAGVSAGLLWTLVGGLLLVRRCRQTQPIGVPWVQALFAHCLTTVGIERRVMLRMSDRFASPTLVTAGRPVVVIPSWCLEQLSPQELKQVFLHELLHYARRDHVTVLIAQLVRVVFFFHPIVWYAGRRLNVEAERACDAGVVTVARRPYSYASSLLKVAEGPSLARWRGVLELARPISLTATRIREVLNGMDDYQRMGRLSTALLLIGLAVLVLPPVFHLPAPPVLSNPPEAVLQSPAGQDAALPGRTIQAERLAARGAEETWASAAADPPQPRETGIAPATATATSPMRATLMNVPKRPETLSPVVFRPSLPQTPSDGTSPRRWFHTAAVGTPDAPPASRTEGLARWQSGQIEFQGGGHPLSKTDLSGTMSVRAGYFVTRTHELGGVLSIIGPTERLDEAGEQADLAPQGTLALLQAVRSRPLVPSVTQQENEKGPTMRNTVMIGAFYRYNVARLNAPVVPFVGVGTGVEVRPGRKDPVLVDGSGGVRCFFADRTAVIVQFDYYKNVDLSARSRVSASLGVSTIF